VLFSLKAINYRRVRCGAAIEMQSYHRDCRRTARAERTLVGVTQRQFVHSDRLVLPYHDETIHENALWRLATVTSDHFRKLSAHDREAVKTSFRLFSWRADRLESICSRSSCWPLFLRRSVVLSFRNVSQSVSRYKNDSSHSLYGS